jgi:hypothetical protein
MRRTSHPALVFAALCGAAAVAIGLIVHDARTRARGGTVTGELAAAAATNATERLYFRYAAGDAGFGKLAYVDLGVAAATPVVLDLPCEVVHASGGQGICLAIDRGVTRPYVAKLFDLERHEVRATLPLGGLPSRTRVARSGRIGATTAFVTGHGYDSVDFSTETLLVDLASGTTLANVETFAFFSGGEPIRETDFNVWGVTFLGDDNVFYATLSTGGRHLLVRGDVAARQAHVVHDDVECPSVSPDGTRVAYKRRFLEDGFVRWQLYVLDLATLAETPLAERRSVDDQLEWLDDRHVLYTLIDTTGTVGNSVWTIAADGSGAAERFLAGASSPALAR